MAHLAKGAPAWLPTPTATDLEVALEVGEPLVGTFRDGVSRYLFTCVIGDLGRLATWAYAPIAKDDLAHLRTAVFETPADLREWADALAARASRYVALTWDSAVECHYAVESGQSLGAAITLLLDTYEREIDEDIARWEKRRAEREVDDAAADQFRAEASVVRGELDSIEVGARDLIADGL